MVVVCAKVEVSRPPAYPGLPRSGTRNPAHSLPRLETLLPYNSSHHTLAATSALGFRYHYMAFKKRDVYIVVAQRL